MDSQPHPRRVDVETRDGLIVARVFGEPDEAILRECHERILSLSRETGCDRVLYDALLMHIPPVEIPLFQRELNRSLPAALRRAVVVPDAKLAFLARLAFGADARVFYEDFAAARAWLTLPPAPPQA